MLFQFSLTKDSVSVKLKPSQMMTTTLGKVFNLQPDSIFLVGDDGSVATSEEGNFDTYEMDNEVTWTVDGNPVRSNTIKHSTDPKSKWKPGPSTVTPLPPILSKKSSRKSATTPVPSASWAKSIEVCSYEASTDSIKKNFNLPIILTENTASVPKLADITSAESFDGEPVVILDNENLRIPDSQGTRGILLTLTLSMCAHPPPPPHTWEFDLKFWPLF